MKHLAAVLFLIAGAGRPIEAQGAEGAARLSWSETQSRAAAVAVLPAGPGPAPARTARPIILGASPREYHVVRVAVPADFGAADSVAFEVEVRAGAQVLGPTHGMLPAGRSDRAVTLTVSPSSSLPAGDNVAAVVVFRSWEGEGAVVRVPLVVRVPVRRAIAIEAERPVTAARPGERVQLRYRIRNAGNAAVLLRTSILTPDGWRVRDAAGEGLDLPPGETRLRTLVVDVPGSADEGSVVITIAALQDGVPAGTLSLYLNVLRADGLAAARAPRLTTSVGNALSSAGESQPALAMALEGELPRQLTIEGQLNLVPKASEAAALRALGSLGFVRNLSFLSLAGPRWSVRGGGVSLPDDALTGTSVWGEGGSLGWRNTRWWADGTLAYPTGGAGSYLAMHAGRRLGALTLAGALTRLDDSLSVRRSLSAATVGLSSVQPTLQWTVEAGSRTWQDGSGVGAMAEVRRRSESGTLGARIVAAPGGTQAFARAARELQISASRRVGRALELSGAGWLSRDGNSAFSDLRSSGWVLQPMWRLVRWLTLRSSVGQDGFDATGLTAAFRSRETQLGVSADMVFGPFAVGLTSTTGQMSRTTSVANEAGIERSITRLTQRATMSWTGRWGELDVELSAERNGAGLGLPKSARAQAFRASRVPLPLGPLAVTGRAEWSEVRPGPGVPPLHTVLVGLDAPLPPALQLTVAAERNEAFYGRGVPVPWIVGVRLSRALSVRALGPAGGGQVFEDLNANGRRDAGERGVSGVVVLVDGRPQSTEARGRFDAPASARVEIDPASLPFGWIVSRADGRDLGVVPTGSLFVTLALGTDSLGRTALVNFERLVVAAYDTAGRRWAYQPSAAGRALFDALPAGEYRVEIEAPDAGAPPAVRESGHVVRVAPGGEPSRATFTIMPRRVRFQRIEPGGHASGAAPSHGPSR